MKEKLITVQTKEEFAEFFKAIRGKDFYAYDVETTGVAKDSEVIGFSVATDVETGYYIILSYWSVEQQKLIYTGLKDETIEFLTYLKTQQTLMHNAGFDCAMTRSNFGIDLMPSVHTDTMLLAFMLDENRACGLKELSVSIFGEDANKEQLEMKESVKANGGVLSKEKYELYKADKNLMAMYGAKDAILTLKLFYHLVPDLYEQELDKFFYDEETMPLLRGPTYDMNNTGLRVDSDRLNKLRGELEAECFEINAFIYKEITPAIQEEYPGTSKKNTFNIGATQQLSWLLFNKLGNMFYNLTEEGRNVCHFLGLKLPYSYKAKREFIDSCIANKGTVYVSKVINPITGKTSREKVIGDYWKYLACGKDSLKRLAPNYKWVERLLDYAKSKKLLNTYVEGIQSRMVYNIINPNFLQHGTTSGRYSCKNPNFQNLPKNDKRIKACIISRPRKVFVGADYSQLEPRVFASFSGDSRLLACFENDDDFYSVIGTEAFEKYDCTLKKEDPKGFAEKYPKLRDIAKVIALSSAYGTTAPKMAPAIGKSIDEAQEIINNYFEKFPGVKDLMLKYHEEAKREGKVNNLFGRPRRIPAALQITELFGNAEHHELPYEARNILNLAMNHPIQSTAASIVNRSAIALHKNLKQAEINAKIVLQVHDSLIAECDEKDAESVKILMQDAMENTCVLPGVRLIAEPEIGKNLAEV